MAKVDLVLLHPPAIYDFRRRPIKLGPISDVIPSTPIFEMYPVGFASISEYLERKGLRVRIVNVALKMLKKEGFDVERLIASLHPRAFGIDLHWMPHCHGSLALTTIIKKYHPDTPVILGGFSATYFHEEIIKGYPHVDYVVRGDSAEEPLLQLMKVIRGGGDLSEVPNLTWRDNGEVIVNPLTHVPSDLNGVVIDYAHIMRQVARYRDLTGYAPFTNWFLYPLTAVFTCRGCSYNCKTCGASRWALTMMEGRGRPAYRDPVLLAKDIITVQRHLNAPIFIIGDIMQPGHDYAGVLLRELRRTKIKNHIVYEFFRPPKRGLLEEIARTTPNFNIQISPESHDNEVRSAFGRPYSNDELEDFLDEAVKTGAKRIDLFFMVGLPKQDYDSVLETASYCRHLLERYGTKRTLFPFVSPLAPFLDPGSMVFEEPERFGYHLLFRTLEEHRQALEGPSWKYFLNYETQWMSRDEIVYSTYEGGRRLNALKGEFGIIDQEMAKSIEERISRAVDMMKRIDVIMDAMEGEQREEGLRKLGVHVREMEKAIVCDKKELEWPTHFFRMNVFKILHTILFHRGPNIMRAP
ncbi:MAG: TIGR04190 family B12-binding domain/radical SAM domain protein [Deltaproteobacteria bacterium]|nr:MAG: TIGR04190 family B12-binding domain/radical SAM domain protein [Deltaproteobacteria bacterium]